MVTLRLRFGATNEADVHFLPAATTRANERDTKKNFNDGQVGEKTCTLQVQGITILRARGVRMTIWML